MIAYLIFSISISSIYQQSGHINFLFKYYANKHSLTVLVEPIPTSHYRTDIVQQVYEGLCYENISCYCSIVLKFGTPHYTVTLDVPVYINKHFVLNGLQSVLFFYQKSCRYPITGNEMTDLIYYWGCQLPLTHVNKI